jgi:tRNA(fMet)-specific endonuclease VapC
VAVILDTNAVSALLTGDAGLGKVLTAEERHHLPVIVIGEYRYGLLRSSHRDHLQTLLKNLIRESVLLLIDETTAQTYALVREELRRKGRPIPENDIWIAALSWQHHQPVVSRDGHFDHVPNLRRIEW